MSDERTAVFCVGVGMRSGLRASNSSLRAALSVLRPLALALTFACAVPRPAPVVVPAPPTQSAPRRTTPPPAPNEVIPALIAEGTQRSHVDADIEYLLDVIGPRLTGSPEMRRANDWTAQRFREYGVDSAYLEPWSFGVGWTRGPMTLRMLAPQRRELLSVSWGWSAGTTGPLAGDVVLMDARSEGDFNRRFAGKLRGTWVMLGSAFQLVNPADPPTTHADSVRADSLFRTALPHSPDETRFFAERAGLIAEEHPAGLIHDGAKQFGLFTMSGSPDFVSPIPQIVIGNDVYSQLQRLAQRGEHARLEADISNTFTRDRLQQYNTVAEIRGSELPDQVVLLGAHLDSWDLATGGTDNGAGAIAVLEAARILAAVGARPKRTIRFVLFSGEEEGLLGSEAYAAAHKRDLDRFQAVLVLDNGTGRITGLALQGHDDLQSLWQSMMEPLAGLGPIAVHSGNKTGTDHLSFIPFGVPAFNYDQLTRGYNFTHHSQVDDYNAIVPGDIAQAATVMAVNAWQLAQLDHLLPRGSKR